LFVYKKSLVYVRIMSQSFITTASATREMINGKLVRDEGAMTHYDGTTLDIKGNMNGKMFETRLTNEDIERMFEQPTHHLSLEERLHNALEEPIKNESIKTASSKTSATSSKTKKTSTKKKKKSAKNPKNNNKTKKKKSSGKK
jgi:hypothetical protein